MPSTGSRIKVIPLPDSPFGAQLAVDLDAEIGPQDRGELRHLLARHQLLVVRGGVTVEQHRKLVSAIGKVLPQGPRVELHAPPPDNAPNVVYLSNVRPDGVNGNAELDIHHEFAYLATPAQGLSLYAEEVSSGAARTRFASGSGAYQRLSPDDRLRVRGLQGLFVANYSFAARNRDATSNPSWPRAVHPIAVRHPLTGGWVVYVSRTQTDRILGLSEHDSEELLARLFGCLYHPENVYEHEWAEGDLVLWDNLMLQHARPANNPAGTRTLRRISFGERSPWEEWPYIATEVDASGGARP